MKQGAFCAICGNTNAPLYDAFCEVCYWKENQSISLKQKSVDLGICIECGAVHLPSGWTNSNTEEDIIQTVLDNTYRWINADIDVEIETQPLQWPRWEDGKPQLIVEITAMDNRIEEFNIHMEQQSLEFNFNWSTCKACGMKKTGGNVTLQFRANNRQMTEEEKSEFEAMVTELVQKSQKINPMAFVVNVTETKYGLDLKLASKLLAESIIAELKKKWIGVAEKNFKLVGEDRDGQRKYAATYLYRIPGVVPGDFVEFEGQLALINSISSKGVEATYVRNGEQITIEKWEDLLPTDPKPFPVSYLIVSHNHSTESYELMDLQDYHTFEVQQDEFPIPLPIGETLLFLEWRGKIFLKPE